MALINCKECGKQISDLAKKCPNCGAPLRNRRGLGFAIASMILGIYASIYTLTILAVESSFQVEQLSVVPITAVMAGLAISFGIISNKKGQRTKLSVSGVVMGTISAFTLVLFTIITLAIN